MLSWPDSNLNTENKMDTISFDDFTKVDIRKGTVQTAEAVPKSKKLLKLTVSFGPEIGTRTILAGIAQAKAYGEVVTEGIDHDQSGWKDSALIGASILAVINLAPRSMFGIESHGMLLAGHDADNGIWLATIPPLVPDGTQIG